MKITQADFAELKSLMLRGLTHETLQGHRAYIVNEGKAKDIEMRLRWDVLYGQVPYAFTANLYKYVNDTHIDTALRRIIHDFEKEGGRG